MRKALNIAPAKRLEQEFHADGWIATNQTPVDDPSELTKHREYLTGNVTDPELIAEFMDQRKVGARRCLHWRATARPLRRWLLLVLTPEEVAGD
ncbi:MAG: hypothetical protein IPJ24_00840 [bacterium]|nr:hypothetical protein [bacterium]